MKEFIKIFHLILIIIKLKLYLVFHLLYCLNIFSNNLNYKIKKYVSLELIRIGAYFQHSEVIICIVCFVT